MGTGTGTGDTRATDAAHGAISSPLLEDASVNGTRGVILNITGGPDFSLAEVNEAATIIQEAAHEAATIIFGAVVDPEMEGKVKITVIATGFDRADAALAATASKTPVDLEHYTQWRRDEAYERPAVAAGGSGGGRIAINRRSYVDMPPAGVTFGPPSEARGGDAAPAPDTDTHPLDMPAFLRRQDG